MENCIHSGKMTAAMCKWKFGMNVLIKTNYIDTYTRTHIVIAHSRRNENDIAFIYALNTEHTYIIM